MSAATCARTSPSYASVSERLILGAPSSFNLKTPYACPTSFTSSVLGSVWAFISLHVIYMSLTTTLD